jgi:superfamily II DNA helicase RecQ
MPETRAENSEKSQSGANRTPESVLREVFGFTAFRGSQRAVIEQVANRYATRSRLCCARGWA